MSTLEWDSLPSSRRLWPLTALFLLLGGLWLWHGTLAALDGRWLYVLFYFPGAPTLFGSWYPARQVYRHRNAKYQANAASISVGDGGVTFGQPRSVRVATPITIVAVVVAGTVFSVGMWTGRLVFPVSASQAIVFPGLGAALAVGYVLTGLWFLVGWARFPEVTCTPTSVTSRQFLSSQTVSWDDIVTVDAAISGRNAGVALTTRHDIPYDRPGPAFLGAKAGPVICPADLLGVGTHRLRDFLAYYTANPHARLELTDKRAGDRVLD